MKLATRGPVSYRAGVTVACRSVQVGYGWVLGAGGESWRDPFTMYRALRDHDPVHHVVPEEAN